MIAAGIGLLGLLVVGSTIFFAVPVGTGSGLLVAGFVSLAPGTGALQEAPVEPPAVEVPRDGVAAMAAVKDAICACQDLACVSGLQPRIQAAGQALAADPQAAVQSAQRLTTIGEEMSACMRALAEKQR